MSMYRWITTALAGGSLMVAAMAAEPGVEELRAQMRELDQKLRILERKQELEGEKAAEKAKAAPVVSLGSGGLQVRSADSNFTFKVRGYVQADTRVYADDHSAGDANDTFLLRRVRPIFEGTVYEKYDFRVMLDFASGVNSSVGNNGFLQDAYVNARFRPELQLQAGKFKEPVGLERLQSGANMLFVERGFPTQLVPNRDVGIMLHGQLREGLFGYEAGIFNGVADGGSGDIETADDDKDIAVRLFAHPFKKAEQEFLQGLGFGVAGTYGEQRGSLRSYTTPGQQRFFSYRSGSGTAASPNVTADGEHWRLAPQFYYYWGPFGMFGEYVVSDQELRANNGSSERGRAQNRAWQVAASYVLTGEENSWKALNPKRPFSPGNGGWGAWEVTARVGQLTLDDSLFPVFANPDTSAQEATSWGVGLNWHLNKNVKLNFNYEQTEFRGGTTDLLEKGEKVFLARAQVAF